MSVDFGMAKAVAAQSLGQTGERRFRLLVLGAQSQSACLWIEKEHLRALVLAIRQVLSQVGHVGGGEAANPDDFPQPSAHEFRVGTVGMGFDSASRTIVLQIGELESGREAELVVRVALEQSVGLAGQMEEIIAAGRPICPLCRTAVDPAGHVCVRSNGRTGQPIPEADGEEEE